MWRDTHLRICFPLSGRLRAKCISNRMEISHLDSRDARSHDPLRWRHDHPRVKSDLLFWKTCLNGCILRSSPRHRTYDLERKYTVAVIAQKQSSHLLIKVCRFLLTHALPGKATPRMQSLDEIVYRLEERHRSGLFLSQLTKKAALF